MARRIAVLLCDRRVAPGLRSTDGRRVFWKPETSGLAHASHLFVLCHATDVHKVAEVAAMANRQHRLRALFIQQDIDTVFLLPMLDGAHLRMLRNVWVHQGSELPERVLNGWETGAADKLIAHAAAVGEHIRILTCALEQLAVPLVQIKALADLPQNIQAQFQIASDGSYLHWPTADIHLDLDALRYVIDPGARDEADARRLLHDKRFGKAVTDLRRDRGLAQSDIKGVTSRHLRRIEEGESRPRLATLRLLAEAHALPLNEYLAELGRRASDRHARKLTEGAARKLLKLRGQLQWEGDLDELRGREPRRGSDVTELKGLLHARISRRVAIKDMSAAVSRQGRRRN
jgi:transcriptional regulator with XRE-family HTH domain